MTKLYYDCPIGGKITHGMSGTKEYRTWEKMRRRCENSKDVAYKRYGGAGIMVCDRWLKFENFLEDMGKKPTSKHQIDRVDNNGNYQPDNCRWATARENQQNTKISKYWLINGIQYESSRLASEALNVTQSTIRNWCDGQKKGDKYYPPKPNCYSELKYKRMPKVENND